MKKIIITFILFVIIPLNNAIWFEYKEYNTINEYKNQLNLDLEYITWEYLVNVKNLLDNYTDDELEILSSSITVRIGDIQNTKHQEIYTELLAITDSVLKSRNNINVLKNINYSTWEKNKLDIYLSNTNNAPLIFYAHGWAWRIWDKENDVQKWKYFAENWFNFATVNYTLSPDADYTQQLTELAKAFKFLKENSDGLVIDSDNTYFMGHSAWGHLISMLWVDSSYLEKEWLKTSDMKKIISLDAGWYDINKIKDNSKVQFALVYKSVFWTNSDDLKDASPINYINWEATIPEFVIFASSSRWEIHDEIQQDFYKKINDSWNTAHIHLYDYEHEDFNKNIWDSNFTEYSNVILWLLK